MCGCRMRKGVPRSLFSRIEAILSWWSVPRTQLRLRLLSIDEPTLNLRRGADGRFSIAGIPLDQDQGDGGVSEWILAQRRIRVRGATLVWEDELRDAPALVFEDLNLALDNDGRRHRFGLTALPPEALASRIERARRFSRHGLRADGTRIRAGVRGNRVCRPRRVAAVDRLPGDAPLRPGRPARLG